MQVNQLLSFVSRFNRGLIIKSLKLLVTLLILSYIYKTLKQDQYQFTNIRDSLVAAISLENLPQLVLIFILVPVNWALESLKWMYLARVAVPVNFWEAFRSTLTGLAIGVAVPAQVGDTAGRVASLKSSRRLTSIGAALVSNGVQFYVAVVAGLFATLLMRKILPLNQNLMTGLISLLVMLILGGICMGIFRKKLINFKSDKKWVKSLNTYLRVIGEYHFSDLVRALGLGSLRYLVILFQFILALMLFPLELGFFSLITPVAMLLLAKTLIPALNTIGDLGIRGIVILWVFENYQLPSEWLIAATLIVWILNILGPLIAGLILIWKYNWKFN